MHILCVPEAEDAESNGLFQGVWRSRELRERPRQTNTVPV